MVSGGALKNQVDKVLWQTFSSYFQANTPDVLVMEYHHRAAFSSLSVLQYVTVKLPEGIIFCGLLNSADMIGEPGAE